MPGTSASHIVFFIAAVVVATSVASIFASTVIRLADDIKGRANDESNAINTKVSIINDASAMPYNSTASTLTIYVKNIGRTLLNENATKAFVDGNYSTMENLTMSLLDGASAWTNGNVIQIVIGNVTLASGDHRVKVVVEHGVSASLEFRI